MPSLENLQLWSSMLETAQKNLMKKGMPRDPMVDEQLEIWRKEIVAINQPKNAMDILSKKRV